MHSLVSLAKCIVFSLPLLFGFFIKLKESVPCPSSQFSFYHVREIQGLSSDGERMSALSRNTVGSAEIRRSSVVIFKDRAEQSRSDQADSLQKK